MADKKKEPAKQGAPKKKGGSAKLFFFMVLFGCLVPFGLPTLLVSLGMLPTLVALFTDTEANRSRLATVGYLNLAGVLPFLIELWEKGQTMEIALHIVRDPFSWVVMLGAAGVGHLILFAVPQMIGSFILNRQEGRLRTLKDGQQQLEAIWGPDVANALPLDTVMEHKGVD